MKVNTSIVLPAHARKLPILLTVLFLTLFALLHLKLISNTFYIDENNSIHSTREGYGDIPLHMTQVSKFAFAPHFDLMEPIYFGSRLQYPFALNMLRGWMLKLTNDWTISMQLPVMLLAIFNILLIFLIYKKLLKQNGLALAAFFMFFLGSGLGAWPYIRQAITNGLGLHGFFNMITNEYVSTVTKFNAVYPAQNIDFGAPLTLSFIHQQTFFLGLAGFLSFMWLFLMVQNNQKKSYLVGAGILLGCLPIMHTHSFVAATLLLFSALVICICKNDRKYLKKLIVISLIGAVLALPQLYFLLGSKSTISTTADFARFRLGWMMGPGTGAIQFPAGEEQSILSLSFINFLWVNFGFILPLLILCAALAWFFYRKNKYKNSNILLFGLASALIFLVVQLIKFQPWDYDNNKLLIYFLFFASPFIIWYISRLFHDRKIIQAFVIITVVVLSTFSGVVDLIPRLHTTKKDLPIMFNNAAQKLAEYVKNNVKDGELVLTSTTHLNPIASLAGRPVLVGYPGWLWTRSISYAARENTIKLFYNSPSLDSDLLRVFPISYILIDDIARNYYKAKPAMFDTIFTRIFTTGNYILYSIPKPLH